MQHDGAQIWNSEIEEDAKQRLIESEFEIFEDAHKDHSCEKLEVSKSRDFFRKTKERSIDKRNEEFFGIQEWNHVLNQYRSAFDSQIKSPEAYLAEEDSIVMEYLNGGEWYSLSEALSTDVMTEEDEVENVVREIGKLAKIKKNENLIHGDLQKRHLFVNSEDYSIGIIDLEGTRRGNSIEEIEAEEENIEERLVGSIMDSRTPYRDEIPEWYEEGYESIPDETPFPTSEYLPETFGSRITDRACKALDNLLL